LGRGIYLLTQSQASYRSASPGPSVRRPSSCFDANIEEANVPANVDVAVEHANARTSAVMNDNDDDNDTNDGDFPDILGEILGATFMALPVSTLISLLVPLTPTSTAIALPFFLQSSPFPFPPSSAAAEKPT